MTEVTDHLNHSTWECKYHVVFTPKYRKKVLFGQIRRDLRDVFHRLARQKGCRIEEGHLMLDHVHILISIPPKEAVAKVIGFLKGKSSIWVAQNISNKKQNFVGHKFWARGYYVSTVGADEKTVRAISKTKKKRIKDRKNLACLTGTSNPNRFERFTFQTSSSAGVIGFCCEGFQRS